MPCIVVACFVVSPLLYRISSIDTTISLKRFKRLFLFIFLEIYSATVPHYEQKLNQYKNCNQKILKLVRHEIEWIGNIVWKIEEYLAFL